MKDGEPFVMVDDKEAPIGLEGPTWIEKEMVRCCWSDDCPFSIGLSCSLHRGYVGS